MWHPKIPAIRGRSRSLCCRRVNSSCGQLTSIPAREFPAWSSFERTPSVRIGRIRSRAKISAGSRLLTARSSERLANLTDSDGVFRRLVSANAGFTYGIWKPPAGYEEVKPRREVEIDIVYGQRKAEHVFKLRRIHKPDDARGADSQGGARKLREPAFVLPVHLNVMAVQFVGDDKELVSVATQSMVTIRTWDVDKKRLKREVKLDSDKHGNFFLTGQLRLSADGQRLAAIVSGQVGVWDTATGKLVKMLTLPQELEHGFLRGLAGTPDLSLIAVGRTPGLSGFSPPHAHAIVWDVASGKVLQTVQHDDAIQVQSLALSHDGKWLASGGQKRERACGKSAPENGCWPCRIRIPIASTPIRQSENRGPARCCASLSRPCRSGSANEPASDSSTSPNRTLVAVGGQGHKAACRTRRHQLHNEGRQRQRAARERGLDQPPLTEEEVLAAIVRTDWKRDVPGASEREFAAFKAVAETRRLPKGSEIEVLTGMKPDVFTLIQLWSIRIIMPALERNGTVGFNIRHTKLGEEKIDSKQVAWGKPDADGLSLGLFLLPKQDKYAIGDRVQMRLFVRNDGKQAIKEMTFWNITWPGTEDFTVTDRNGGRVEVRNSQVEEWSGPGWIAGAMSGALDPGNVHAFRIPFELAIGGDGTDKLVGRVIDARPGQTLQLRLRAQRE